MKRHKDSYPLFQFLADINRFVHPYRWRFWPAVLLRLSSDIARLYPVYAVGSVVALLSAGGEIDTQRIVVLLALWPVLLGYASLGHGYSKYIGNSTAEKAGLDAFFATLRHVYSLDLLWQETENSGNKLKRANRGYDGINRVLRNFFNVLIEASVNTVGILLIFVSLEPWIAASLLAYIISFYAVGTFLTFCASRQEYIVNKIEEDIEGVSFESLNNIKTLKALSIDRQIAQRIGTTLNRLKKAVVKRVALFQFRNGTLVAFYFLYQGAMVATITYWVLQGRAEISLLVVFVGYLDRVAESAWELADTTQELVISRVWIQRMMGILRIKPIIENPHVQQLSYPKNWRQLRISNVSFGYEDGVALKGLNLTIKRGEKVGIVGLSGAGKSTLFKLLLDLYEDYDGDICLDDVSLKDVERRSYIGHLAVVLQETELFNLSLEENIRLAAGTNSPASLKHVLRDAHLAELIERLPKSVDTVVGEKGVKLSGGERQRVGIARALYRNPDILLMDEATSHLDAHSEKSIQQALHTFFGKVTAIVIAHRLSTIKEMDRIVVLDQGRVAEEGTFTQLVRKQGGLFAKMWRAQKL